MCEPKQGMMPTRTPYTVISSDMNHKILCDNNTFATIESTHLNKETIAKFVILFNIAYQNGYHECSVDLLNKKE